MDNPRKRNVSEEPDVPSFQPRPYKAELVAELIDLDRDIMKLMVRRAKLVGKLRGGREHAATPAAAKAEKDVRTAWEKNAASFSRDEKFARQLFTLLQEVRVDSLADSATRNAFNLAPPRRPVAVNLPGPRSVTATRMLATLAAWFGDGLVLDNILLNDPLMDTAKALNSAGARFSWAVGARAGEGTLRHAATGVGISLATDKALFIGEDILTMYLMAFLAAARTGKARFTGGSGLKMADLTPLRRFLPELGARLAHSVPKSNGLPGSVEASGLIPESIVLPADLPREGVMALLCAAAAWRKKVSIDCAALPLPLFTSAFAECLPVLRACSVTDGMRGTVITIDATGATVPEDAVCPLDPALSGYLLALPAFAGGVVSLSGAWETALPLSSPVEDILSRGGLAVRVDGEGVHASVCDGESAPYTAMDLTETDAVLVPLGVALAARRAWRKKAESPMPLLPESLDPEIVEGFCAHLGLACRGGMLIPRPGGRDPGDKSSWTSPAPEWAFAYALCAYDCQNILLTNPSVVASLMPSFWPLYNALPDPSEAKKVPEKEEKQRRRIIAR